MKKLLLLVSFIFSGCSNPVSPTLSYCQQHVTGNLTLVNRTLRAANPLVNGIDFGSIPAGEQVVEPVPAGQYEIVFFDSVTRASSGISRVVLVEECSNVSLDVQ